MTISNSRIISLGGPSFYLPTPLDSPWYLSGGISVANCVAAYRPKGAASLAESYTNLANPGTYTAAPGVAPTWDGTSWIFDGSTQYLTTGVTPVNNQTWSVIVRFSGITLTTSYGIPIGNYKSYPSLSIWIGATTDNHVYYDNGSELTGGAIITSGVLAVAGNKGYKNGIAESGTIGTNAGTMQPLIIGASQETTRSRWYKGNIQAISIYSAVITAAQVLAVTNAMNLL